MIMLLYLEAKKILASRAILLFFVLCLGLNVFNILDGGRTEHGQTLEPENVFDGYDTGALAELYINRRSLTGARAEDMRAKYAAMQIEVDQKAERGDALSPYFTDHTPWEHEKLFHSAMTALCTQGILLTVLITLYILGFENLNRTEQTVYATKTGRRLMARKFAAAVAMSLGAYLLLTALTLSLYFSRNDFSGVWGDNVSSGFNYVREVFTVKPFMTWRSFTVLTYLMAVIGITVGLMVCFALACFAVGTAVRNSYIAFLTVFAAACSLIVVPMILPGNSLPAFAFMLTPMWLWLKQPAWFTDGGFDILWSNFETWGVWLSLAVLTLSAVLAAVNFGKKELV